MDGVDIIDVGDKVKHAKFGQGTVMLRLGDGDNAKVTVKFGGEVGEKKLMLKYANLKKVNERPTLASEGGEAENTETAGENA